MNKASEAIVIVPGLFGLAWGGFGRLISNCNRCRRLTRFSTGSNMAMLHPAWSSNSRNEKQSLQNTSKKANSFLHGKVQFLPSEVPSMVTLVAISNNDKTQ
jgi:hypothetical protein